MSKIARFNLDIITRNARLGYSIEDANGSFERPFIVGNLQGKLPGFDTTMYGLPNSLEVISELARKAGAWVIDGALVKHGGGGNTITIKTNVWSGRVDKSGLCHNCNKQWGYHYDEYCRHDKLDPKKENPNIKTDSYKKTAYQIPAAPVAPRTSRFPTGSRKYLLL